jgi:hypothetical protein
MNTLKYYLTENLLTSNPHDYMAQPELKVSLTAGDVIDEMLRRGTLITRTDVIAVLNLYEQVVSDFVSEGYSLNLPLFIGAPLIYGVFNGPEDLFDENRHVVKFNLNPGFLIRDAVKKMKIEKSVPVNKSPFISQYVDIVSATINDRLTPGGIGELQGSRLNFDTNDIELGIYFIAANGSEFKAVSFALIKPRKLIFCIPDLPSGAYNLEVRVKFRNSTMLRKTSFNKILTVT